MYRASFSTAIDVENFYCTSAPVVSYSRVISSLDCFMMCMHEDSCIYFNLEAIDESSDVMCSLTDISKVDLSQPAKFTHTGTWYSFD